MTDKIASYIGLAQRANAVIYGEDKIKENFSSVKIVLIDLSAPEKYRERLKFRCADKPCFEIAELTCALHRENVKAAAILNEDLAQAVINLLR